MENQFNIRELYAPLQPTVVQTADALVTYQEVLPDTNLQPFIYCYWELKTSTILSRPFSYRVVADGCIDIFFDLNRVRESFIMGFCNKYVTFDLETSFHYVGIRFLPSMFPNLFKISALELNNRVEPLEIIVPQVGQFIASHFSPALSFPDIKSLLDVYFTTVVSEMNLSYDRRLYRAIEIIFKKDGLVNTEKDLDVGLSSRQLRRLFEYYIGTTQKTFSQVVRFQRMIKENQFKDAKAGKSFLDQGYYDQAHFIKDFKTFYGLTPKKVL
ncbi:AraC family transcriptional regulator [Pedobacter sp. UBA5917]|uniref:AraC family transcriptional regulator n=1 Tax=Pedobacter sp. UBA5917 TaxID=1947061 RepID=UPI0025DBDDBD|nr:helix-turn-helix domain-containing protein [Pedobacter sp. UBA5917]